jgi:LmbE family N-acetylglucosaminyl deacetylase
LTTAARRLLCITAHPDDESGAFGGALMLAHQRGIETYLVCLTDGQAAHYRGDAQDNDELGRLRRAELAAACQLLGITHHEVLHYPDGELARENFYALTGVIVSYIRRWRPQIVLTFGGDGGVNLHRDHVIVSLATTAAFHWANRPEFFPEQIGVTLGEHRLELHAPRKLYHSSPPFVGVRNRPELAASPTLPYSLTLDLGELGERKLEAFRQHSTQHPVLARVGNTLKEHFRYERYLLAAAPGLKPIDADRDLFDGI